MQLLVNIDVPDFEAGRRFYTEALGLTEGRRFGEGGVELLGGSSAIYLLVKPSGSQATANGAVRDYGRHWTPVHLDLVVDDLDAALVRARAAGAVLERGPVDAAWGRIAGLADPFGNGFCLLSFTASGYDAVATP
ncbi:VOC family protein [Ancylobacter sp. 6x-1]|uniref:VOC family protein n=1 Tax=Ancylobacter crimeensis TaxID=2579147 RepID=A0ABT0DC23_9HYPH|nr:VOC family protein [Ancylobacter crimeensis]MCK0197508.1 VOC family protein [Ancylobacter crimeensis]